MSTAFPSQTLDITYKYHYVQVLDTYGDTWTRTKNSLNEWVWALGDYEENAPIFNAEQYSTLPLRGWPYLVISAQKGEACCTNHKATTIGSSTGSDPINPNYYKFPSGAEAADIAEYLTSNGGQIVQYVARSTRIDGLKKGDSVEDLEKASKLLNREIKRLKREREQNNG